MFLAGCVTHAPVAEWSIGERNACLPEAAVMVQGLSGAGIQAKVLLVTTPAFKHAVAVYLYPAGDNRLWVWDSTWKSLRVRAWWDDAAGVARAWGLATGRELNITGAEFL